MRKKCRCGNLFEGRKEKIYCSANCAFEFRKIDTYRKNLKECTNCKKLFSKWKSPEIQNGVFCSRKCWQEYSKGTDMTSNFGDTNPSKRPEIREKIRLTKLAELNPNWKGENVQYGQLHNWVKARKPKPDLCEECHQAKPYDLANISQLYLRDIKDFEWLCRKCHMEKDGRLENFKKKAR